VSSHAATGTRARRTVLGAMLVLGLLVLAAALELAPWPAGLLLALAWLAPLLLPLAGVLRGSRRTCAWATLCVAPYLIAGVTETIANPALRALAAAIVFAGLAWFAALIRYLRVTRPATGARPPAPPAPA
jgi:uncharacterized membrane protein